MSDKIECGFNKAWIGDCKERVALAGDRCSEHEGIECSSCGKAATHECAETGSFVCGFPLCDDCEHTICENGCNGGAPLPEGYKMHCKKEDQVFKPWYEKEQNSAP